MTTTALYVELIVIGVQVELWMLILVDIFYRGVVKSLIGFADNAFIIIAALIPAYVLGMIFDRIADRVFYRRERKIKKDSGLQTSSSILIEETPKMHEFQLYSRSKYRVLRATTLNLPIITIALLLNLFLINLIDYTGAAVILVCGVLLSVISLWGSIKTAENFYCKAQLIENHHNKK